MYRLQAIFREYEGIMYYRGNTWWSREKQNSLIFPNFKAAECEKDKFKDHVSMDPEIVEATIKEIEDCTKNGAIFCDVCLKTHDLCECIVPIWNRLENEFF